jgi:hypothetical protein
MTKSTNIYGREQMLNNPQLSWSLRQWFSSGPCRFFGIIQIGKPTKLRSEKEKISSKRRLKRHGSVVYRKTVLSLIFCILCRIIFNYCYSENLTLNGKQPPIKQTNQIQIAYLDKTSFRSFLENEALELPFGIL